MVQGSKERLKRTVTADWLAAGRGAQVETLPSETDGKPGGEWEGMNRRFKVQIRLAEEWADWKHTNEGLEVSRPGLGAVL